MHVRGLMNMQYAIENGQSVCAGSQSEASPYRASGIKSMQYPYGAAGNGDHHFRDYRTAVSDPGTERKSDPVLRSEGSCLPVHMFQEVDPVLGPEMRSTGEVLGLSHSYGEAFFKAQEAVQAKAAAVGHRPDFRQPER